MTSLLRPEIGALHRHEPGAEAGLQGVLRGQSVCPPPPHTLSLQVKSRGKSLVGPFDQAQCRNASNCAENGLRWLIQDRLLMTLS
jgi:hypothetical protein